MLSAGQDFEGSAMAYIVDALGISIGSLFGSPPVTAYIESGAGISEGGITGITAMVTGVCFFISVFFAPIFASIPPWATGSTLIIVGSMMMKAAADINWSYPGDGIPAFVTIMVMPFTYSIAYGLIAGIITYIILNTGAWLIETASGGRIVPYGKELKDHWTWRIPGGFFPKWVVRIVHGDRKFWKREEYHDGLSGDVGGTSTPQEKVSGEPRDAASVDLGMGMGSGGNDEKFIKEG